MTTGPINIDGIPLEGTRAGVDADAVGAAEAKKYLAPGGGEKAGAPEEYITPNDVGHAFDVIYRDIKNHSAVFSGDKDPTASTPEIANGPHPDGAVYINITDHHLWTWDTTGGWTDNGSLDGQDGVKGDKGDAPEIINAAARGIPTLGQAAALGKPGDLIIDPTNQGQAFKILADGSLSKNPTLQFPVGPTGPQGTQGPVGATGAVGSPVTLWGAL